MLMSPRPRPGDIYPLPPEIQPKEAGVLLLLFPVDHDLHFFLTRRTDTVETHKGQISLPGGAQEAGESLQETAVREICEELNLRASGLQVLGALSPVYIPVSGFRVTPFIAFTTERPECHPEPGEVVEIIETSLETILDEKNRLEEDWEIRGIKIRVPFFQINGHKVWGATAMMLGELVEMLKKVQVVSEAG